MAYLLWVQLYIIRLVDSNLIKESLITVLVVIITQVYGHNNHLVFLL